MKGDKINSIFEAIRESEQRTFTTKDWQRFIYTIAKTKEEAVYLRGYLSEHGWVERVVRLTEKGKARLKK